jgi:hypothetical protein
LIHFPASKGMSKHSTFSGLNLGKSGQELRNSVKSWLMRIWRVIEIDCVGPLELAPVCADPSWSLWTLTTVSPDFNYFCCPGGQVGLKNAQCGPSSSPGRAPTSIAIPVRRVSLPKTAIPRIRGKNKDIDGYHAFLGYSLIYSNWNTRYQYFVQFLHSSYLDLYVYSNINFVIYASSFNLIVHSWAHFKLYPLVHSSCSIVSQYLRRSFYERYAQNWIRCPGCLIGCCFISLLAIVTVGLWVQDNNLGEDLTVLLNLKPVIHIQKFEYYAFVIGEHYLNRCPNGCVKDRLRGKR